MGGGGAGGGGRMASYSNTQKNFATAIMILVQLAFAGWHVLGKVALNTGVSPLFFALIREAGASLVLLLLAAVAILTKARHHRMICLDRGSFHSIR